MARRAKTVEDEPPKSIKWACITLHPKLPSKAEQISGARAWGAHEDWLGKMDVSTTFTDDATKLRRTTKFSDKLPQRAALIAALHPGAEAPDLVFFRSPLCVGFSRSHARETIEAIWAKRGLVYVQTLDMLLREGDDTSALLALVERDAKAKHQAEWRARRRGKAEKE